MSVNYSPVGNRAQASAAAHLAKRTLEEIKRHQCRKLSAERLNREDARSGEATTCISNLPSAGSGGARLVVDLGPVLARLAAYPAQYRWIIDRGGRFIGQGLAE
jgi:hypothetical protein